MRCVSRIADSGDLMVVLLRGTPTDEKLNDSPLGRGKGRQALGWVVE